MAEIRVMLKFDYPPPTGPESRHMWMLLNPEHLRTVTDLSDLIRGRYYPNLRGALCLYVHDCLLPPGESARLVRDNDLIRVQWRAFDPEDDDMDGPAHPTKKRSRQRCEEDDAGDGSATGAKKRKCETPRGREECEEEEPPKSSRRKAKKKKKVLEEGAQEEFPEESSKRSKHKKRPEDSASLKALEKILTLLGPNQGPSTKRGRGSSSSHQEPSEVSIQPITTIPLQTPSPMTLRLLAALSGANVGTPHIDDPSGVSLEPATPLSAKKPSEKSGQPPTPLSEIPPKPGNKSNNDPPGRSAGHTSSGDSESSTDQRSSTNPKRPPKRIPKKTKPNHKLLTGGATKSSLADSSESSSDEESSKPKGPPKVHNKAGTVKKTKPNRDLPTKKSTGSSSGSSSDEESTKPKEPPKVHTKAKPNHEILSEGATKSSHRDSSESSSDEESSKPKEPPKVHNKAGTVSSVKTNPSHGPPAKKSTRSSSGSSSDEESTKPKEPPKRIHKSGTVNKTKPNHKLLTEGATKSSLADSSESSSDEESSAKPKEPPKVHNKVGTVAAVNKTNPNVGASAPSTRSSVDHTASSYDQENQSEAPRNPSDSVPGRTVSSSETRKTNDSDSDNREFRRRMYGGTAPPLNGTSQKPHKDAPSSGSDSDTNQEPGTAQYPSRGAPSGVTNGGLHRGPDPNLNLYDQGRGRGRGIVPWRGQGGRGPRGWGDRGKGRGGGHQFFHNYDSPSLKKQQLEEDATNTSMVIQNPPESPKKDYSAFPLLAGPPQVGKIIAFKILELDENYSPELSDYKEGVVRSVDPVTQQVELELLAKQKRREPGKFDLVYEMEDGREIVEFAVRPDRKMKEAWSSLITPRLVMDKEFEKGTPAQTL